MNQSWTVPDSDLARAFAIAEWLHKDQKRKNKDRPHEPEIAYLTHLTEVLSLMIQGHASVEQQIAGLLHDAIEDQFFGENRPNADVIIREAFGQRVLDMVLACSDSIPDPTQPAASSEEKAPWRSRKEAHIAHIRSVAKTNPDFLLVTLCDKISNSHSIVSDVRHYGDQVWARFNNEGDPRNTAWYYKQMRDVILENQAQLPHCDALIARLKHNVRVLNRQAHVSWLSDKFRVLAGKPSKLVIEEVKSEED
jgi:(p)ppGpp synthase/HD superfamily hydrolase